MPINSAANVCGRRSRMAICSLSCFVKVIRKEGTAEIELSGAKKPKCGAENLLAAPYGKYLVPRAASNATILAARCRFGSLGCSVVQRCHDGRATLGPGS